MTSDELAAALSDHLRHRGVDFHPTELKTFTADIAQGTTDAPDLNAWAARFIEFRRPTAPLSWGWRRFGRIFAVWFAVLMAFFLLANLAGLVRSAGLYPGRETGFPFTFAEWRLGELYYFSWSKLTLDLLTAIVISSAVASACAFRRCRAVPVGLPQKTRVEQPKV